MPVHPMKRRSYILPALVAASIGWLAVSGCDSTDTSDLDRFIGTWTLTEARDAEGDKTAVFAALGSLTLTLNDDDTHLLEIDLTDPEGEDVSLPGTYTVSEVEQLLQLAITFGGVPVNLPFDYSIEDEDTIVLTAGSAVIVALLGEAGSLLVGDVTLTIERVN
jgi:hypothetical protein